MKKLLLFIGLLFLLTLNPSFAENFYIDNFNVSVDVQNNGSFVVLEKIDAYFTTPSHGIIRSIPKRGAKIRYVKAADAVDTYSDNGILNIKMGDPDKLISNNASYSIKYQIVPKKVENEFYFNIIGNEWQTDINNASFEITLPKGFDSSKVHIYSGSYKSETNKKNVSFSVKDNIIKGYTTEKLNPNEGITVFVSLQEGYFDNDNSSLNILIGIIISILTFLVFLVWWLFGKDDHVTPVVTFNSPENVDVLDSEIVLNLETSEKGFVSYIIELASKNYIKIDENDGNFILTNLCDDYTNLDQRTKQVLEIVFKGKNQVKKDELTKSTTFYKEVEKFLKKVNKSKFKSYQKSSLNAFLYVLPFLFLFFILFLLTIVAVNYDEYALLFGLITVFAPFLFSLSGFLNDSIFTSVIFCSVFLFALNSVFQSFDIIGENLPILIFGIICIVICLVCIKQLPKRNSYGNKILGELLGLKHFIKTAQKHKLEKMVNDDPSYFYNILPYAYLLGVSDIWIKQFEDIFSNHPEYKGAYITSNSFSNFTKNMSNCSIPTYENGGIKHSSSGGGFSGGGHGGGGGSSW